MPTSGRVTFAYTSNNGIRAIGAGNMLFETKWSNASDVSIHAYNDPPSIDGIALATGAVDIADVRDAARFDYSSRHVTPRTGQIILLRNRKGIYAAIQVLAIRATSHGSSVDEVTFRYVILPDGSRDFSRAASVEVVDFGRCVLLLGAGFSRNWGGLLASEVQKYIFRHPGVQARTRLRLLVFGKPFEDALQETRTGVWEAEDQAAVETAIRAAFDQMDASFRNPNPPVLNATANDFISRFCPGPVGIGTGYVFSLNQDLLLERIYGTIVNRQQLVIPGVNWLDRPPQRPAGGLPFPDATPVGEAQIEKLQLLRNFNLIKLHGSINWRPVANAPGLVMGRRKMLTISTHPLLAWNFHVFEKALASGHVRLMVVGYSWGDEHINDVIANAVRDHGLRVYSWNTAAPQGMIRAQHRGAEILEGLMGYSTRPLTEVMPPTGPGSPEYDSIVASFF